MPESSDRPNILFFFADQHRPDWLGTNDRIPVRTPHLDALACRGVQFTNAFSPSPLCGPARACLASGRAYDRSPVRINRADYPLDYPTVYGRLRDQGGYHVLGCGKFDLMKDSKAWGLDGTNRLDDWGFSDGVNQAGLRTGAEGVRWKGEHADEGLEHALKHTPADPYTAFLAEQGVLEDHIEDLCLRRDFGPRGEYTATFPTPLPEEAYWDNWAARRGLDLLEDRPSDDPWFLMVNFNGPHTPMDVTQRMHRRYRGELGVDFPQPVDPAGDFRPDTHNAIRRNYSAKVSTIDDWVGTYLTKLKEWGELEDTLVVYASDHGEMLGDYGCWSKGVPYHPSIGIPMLAAGPGVEARGRCDALVDLIDLHATFLDYAGVPVPDGIESRSLRPVLGGGTEHRQHVTTGLGGWRAVFDGRYKLIDGFESGIADDDGRHLFDLADDPHERDNLSRELTGEAERLARYLPEADE